MDNVAIAKALFAALSAHDDAAVRSLCSPDLRLSQNNGPVLDLETMLGFNNAVGAVVKEMAYYDEIRAATPTGFVEEHNVKGTMLDGTEFTIAACVVGEVADGKITEMREYFDTASASALIAALS